MLAIGKSPADAQEKGIRLSDLLQPAAEVNKDKQINLYSEDTTTKDYE